MASLQSTRRYSYGLYAVLIICIIYVFGRRLQSRSGDVYTPSSGLELGATKGQKQRCSYPGWAGIKNIIVFGDSYSTVGWNPDGPLPSDQNPFGNPEFPYAEGTSANGPNWINFLTTTYNQSKIYTLDFGIGGATIDADLVEQLLGVWSFKQQVEFFLRRFTLDKTPLKWDPATTLFVVFFGINDVYNSYRTGVDLDALYTKVMDVYSTQLDIIYDNGARNFLVLNVPPMERAPLSTLGENKVKKPELRAALQNFNRRIERVVTQKTNQHGDSTWFLFDVFAMWDKLFMDMSSNPHTAPYKELQHCCSAYEDLPKKGSKDWYAFKEECKYPVDQYFWFDLLHPTFRIHNATAEAVVQRIRNEGGCNKNDNPF